MRAKKVLSIVLAAGMTMGLTAGMATTAHAEFSTKELQVNIWDNNQLAGLQQIADEWSETSGVKVTINVVDWDNYWTLLEAGASGGQMPDVFWMHSNTAQMYMENDLLLNLDDYIANDDAIDLANYYEGIVDLYNSDGVQYALPKDHDTIALLYNKAIFDKYGVDYPTDDWTWEDMAEKAKALTKDDGSVYGIGAGFDTQCGIYNTIYACGGYIISEDKKSSGYDLEETQAGVQCWIDLQEAGVSPSEASLEETTADAQFLSGRLAMYWGGSWFLGAVKTSDIMGDIDVVELPSIEGKKATVIHGLGNCIYEGTKSPDAAKAWVAFLAGETANLISAETGAAIPALAGTAQAWVDGTPEINLKSFIKSSEEYSYPYPASANTAEWQTYEADCLKKAFSLDVPVADACADLAGQMNEVLAAE